MLGTQDATEAVVMSLKSELTDATLTTELGTGLTFTTVGAPHVSGSARIEDGRPSLSLTIKGAWRASVQGDAGGEAVAGSYTIDRVVDDPEFAGGIGPLSPVLTADAAAGSGGGGRGHALTHARARAPAALAEKVKAAVHAGLDAVAKAA